MYLALKHRNRRKKRGGREEEEEAGVVTVCEPEHECVCVCWREPGGISAVVK